jgi:hypothetical protein
VVRAGAATLSFTFVIMGSSSCSQVRRVVRGAV